PEGRARPRRRGGAGRPGGPAARGVRQPVPPGAAGRGLARVERPVGGAVGAVDPGGAGLGPPPRAGRRAGGGRLFRRTDPLPLPRARPPCPGLLGGGFTAPEALSRLISSPRASAPRRAPP